jgi:acyl-CoA synthetase (AMP-forming)/AMP-acid ligase II
VLALMAPNMPEYAVVFHAVAMAGWVVTTINPAYAGAEVRAQLQDSGARLLVTIPPLAAAASRAAAGTGVAEIYVLGEAHGAKPLASLSGMSPAR